MKTSAMLVAATAAAVNAGTFNVLYETEAGNVTFEIHEEWAPLGAARFKQLIQDKFYDNAAFFRYVPNFVVQWGISADPKNNNYTEIKDDKWGVVSNLQGTLVYATGGNDTRTTQLFVNFKNNSRLDALGFTPFGIVTSGYDVLVNKTYSGYGESPDQDKIYEEGDAYLKREFPLITHIKKASFITHDGC
ncbi:unnamed protein product [Aphanomyces euteiches]|uniref:Peptidyl-prolyl cis-trans isomerase n=1 Tax=Aphanomyces euteiches TaxID=100861 RepID=A0A6G0XVR8_9STRA|nr:hypothetical protein Ae201684_001082 [Aphanomyces euteiches]KAH9145560.1 hypothetical protein AeRB84_010550 [Aphanomyces euteiches]